jgi:hypothetical protein
MAQSVVVHDALPPISVGVPGPEHLCKRTVRRFAVTWFADYDPKHTAFGTASRTRCAGRDTGAPAVQPSPRLNDGGEAGRAKPSHYGRQ